MANFCNLVVLLVWMVTSGSATENPIRRVGSLQLAPLCSDASIDSSVGKILIHTRKDALLNNKTWFRQRVTMHQKTEEGDANASDLFEIQISGKWCYILSTKNTNLETSSIICYAVILHNLNVTYRIEIFGRLYTVKLRKNKIYMDTQLEKKKWEEFISQFKDNFVVNKMIISVEQYSSDEESRVFGIGSVSIVKAKNPNKFVFKFKSIQELGEELSNNSQALHTAFSIAIDHQPGKTFLPVGIMLNSGDTLVVNTAFNHSETFGALIEYCETAHKLQASAGSNGITLVGVQTSIKILARSGSAETVNCWLSAQNVFGYKFNRTVGDIGGRESIQEIELCLMDFDKPPANLGPRRLHTAYFELASIRGWAGRPKITHLTILNGFKIALFKRDALEFSHKGTKDMRKRLCDAVSSGDVLVTVVDQQSAAQHTLLGVKELGFDIRFRRGWFTFREVTEHIDPPPTLPISFVAEDYWAQQKTRFEQEYNSPHLSDAEFNDFELLEQFGYGSFGDVRLVKHKETEKHYAMKILDKAYIVQTDHVAQLLNEKQIIASVDFPFVIPLRYHFHDAKSLYLVMDFINGGDLFTHRVKKGTFSEEECLFIAAQLVLTLEYLHNLDVVYRDLKSENVLLGSDGYILLTDFGVSKKLDNTLKTHTFCGTPDTMAPEIITELFSPVGYGKEVDWWALGCTLLDMFTGHPPFYNTEQKKTIESEILYKTLKFENFGGSSDFRNFLESLLERNPAKRYGANQARDDPWFRNVRWAEICKKSAKPPYKPPVISDVDTSNFNYTGQQIKTVWSQGHDTYGERFDMF